MPKIKLSPWLVVELCLFWHLDSGFGLLAFTAAVLLHEMAHIACICLCHGTISDIRLGPTGVFLRASLLSLGAEAVCALAGPIASLLLALTVMWFPALAFWGLAQGTLNLLPIYPSDGGRFLYCLFCLRYSEQTASRTIALISLLCLSALSGLVIWIVLRIHRLSILLCLPIFLAVRLINSKEIKKSVAK